MSLENDDDTVHLTGEHIDTMILALLCLDAMWTNYPDVVRALAIEQGQPDLVGHGPKAKLLLVAILGLRL